MVLRRLSGKTENTSPVLTLITQFGGGKTHTLTSLYHLANAGAEASKFPGIADLLNEAGMTEAPSARVGVFVGNAWDPAGGARLPGSIWLANWRATRASLRLALPRRTRRRELIHWPKCSPPRRRPCCCCSMRF